MVSKEEARSLVGGTKKTGGLTRRATTLTKRESIATFKHDLLDKDNDSSKRWFAAKSAFFGGLGGLLAGWDIGAIAGAMLQLTDEFKLSDKQKELVASTMVRLGALCACRAARLAMRTTRPNMF